MSRKTMAWIALAMAAVFLLIVVAYPLIYSPAGKDTPGDALPAPAEGPPEPPPAVLPMPEGGGQQ